MKTKIHLPGAGLHTSVESVKQSSELAASLWDLIVELARSAGRSGLTINEAERLIGDHKNRSISPRFSELLKRKRLVRVIVGHGEPTDRFPSGVPQYWTRYDEETRRRVVVHWLPEFAPSGADWQDSDEKELGQ